jgi:hypothetical protein
MKINFFWGCALSLATVLSARASIVVGPTVNPANGHTYYLLSASESWTDSEAEAVGLGGHLVTINDAAENAWVRAIFPSSLYENLWLGLNDAAVEGTFVWVSGEPVTYENWNSGEPNGWIFENYGQMYSDYAGGTWNDRPDYGWPLYGVVEVAPVPEAATYFTGTLLLLPFGVSMLRHLRKHRTA